MKVKDVEELLQLTRANIRFYEKEGLLNPQRNENGYRTYSEEDIEQLKKIILFRKLGVPVQDIKKIFNGEETISATVSQNIDSLNAQLREINGAIDICKQMEKDTYIDTSFDYNKYWNLMKQEELDGNVFYDTMKDYIKFEGDSFKSMWKTVFFYDLEGSIKKRGWIIALLIIIGICVIRGLAVQFIWKSGNFWYGFSYPFVLFMIISGISFPLYILNSKYGEKEVPEEPSKTKMRTIPLLGLWKVLGEILYFIILLFGIPIFWDNIIYDHLMYSGINYIITGSSYILYAIVALYLFVLSIWLYSKNGIFGNVWTRENGFKSHLPKRLKKKVFAVSVCIFMVVVVVYGTWYNCITEQGVTQRHFFWTKSYTWEDINYYTLSANFDGTLQYTIIMNDGTPISIMGGSSSSSNINKKEYPEGEDDFILFLTKEFVERGIPIKANNWEKLHDKLSYDYWDEYLEEIRSIVE